MSTTTNELEITEKDQRRLKKVKINLMRNPKFALWSGILMVGETKLSTEIPTACTNGRDDIYGVEFIRGLSDKELGFVILHEGLHKAFRHMTTWKKLWKENPQLTNAACDYVINLIAVDCDPDEQVIAMPRKEGKVYGLYDERFRKMHTKQVYDILKKEQKGKGGSGSGSGSGEGGSGEGFDEHDWEGAGELSEKEVKELEAEVDRAIRQGQIAAKRVKGTGAGGSNRELDELLEPKFDWRELLRDFMTNACRTPDTSTWRRPNRRFLHQDIYMPTMQGESMGELVAAVDTSGSVSAREVQIFLSEIASICETVKPEKLHVLYWDGAVATPHEVYTVSNLNTLEANTRVIGGGGTSPSVVPPYLDKEKINPECVVMLTDGHIGNDFGEQIKKWEFPLLWVISANKACSPNVGKSVYVESWE